MSDSLMVNIPIFRWGNLGFSTFKTLAQLPPSCNYFYFNSFLYRVSNKYNMKKHTQSGKHVRTLKAYLELNNTQKTYQDTFYRRTIRFLAMAGEQIIIEQSSKNVLIEWKKVVILSFFDAIRWTAAKMAIWAIITFLALFKSYTEQQMMGKRKQIAPLNLHFHFLENEPPNLENWGKFM